MQYEKTQAFVLHSRAFKETSLILHCFTLKFGMVSVLAKGIKRKNSQAKRAILQPFNQLLIRFSGRGELKTLCDSELLSFMPQPVGKALACCYYLNELTIRALKEWQEYPELFETYQQVIKSINLCESQNLPELLRGFELSLISFLGLSPSWRYDIEERLIDVDSYYEYIIESGFKKLELTNQSTARNGFSGKTLLSIEQNNFSNIDLKECQKLTQKLIRPLIGSRPLESRKMWIQ